MKTIKGIQRVLQFKTLSTIMTILNHSRVDLLKMDIERFEYEVVSTFSTIALPNQISFESHFIDFSGRWGRYVSVNEWTELWSTLGKFGYRIISRESNPFCLCCLEWTVHRVVGSNTTDEVPVLLQDDGSLQVE